MLSSPFISGILLGAVLGPVVIYFAVVTYVQRRGKAQAYQPPWLPTAAAVPLDWTVEDLDGVTVILSKHLGGQIGFVRTGPRTRRSSVWY
jgi:hypothetical protein